MATTYSIHPAADIAQSESRTVQTIYATLKIMLGAVAIVVGIDKFTNFIADWEQYLNPLVLRVIPISPLGFMRAIGVVEVIAGIILFTKPRLGGFILMAWLLAIAAQLIVWGRYLDIAARDIVMALGAALTLARLAPFALGSSRATVEVEHRV